MGGLGKIRPMPFTVYAEYPGRPGHSEFVRTTAAGAMLKAADLIGTGWLDVHICDEKHEIYWPGRLTQAMSKK